jgi:hypothetical protein
MSLNRISFLEAFPRGRDHDLESDEDPDVYQDLPDSPLSSSFPSTYSRLNFNPYAGPGWTESVVGEEQDQDQERQSTFLGLSPTTTRENQDAQGRVDLDRDSPVPGHYSAELGQGPGPGPVGFKEPQWAVTETTGAFEVSPAKRISMYACCDQSLCINPRQHRCVSR